MSEFILLWRAIYNDETWLNQVEADHENKYTDIDRNKLIAFELWSPDYLKPVAKINLEPGQRLIYRRRVRGHVLSPENIEVMYLVGWQQTVQGQNVQSILCIHKDGSIEVIGQWSEKDAWYCSPVLRDEEK